MPESFEEPKAPSSQHAGDAKPLVSIVVRSYNESRFIRRLFVGVASQSYPNIEVVLVDSGSTDETVSIAKSFGARIVHISSAEFSFGRSLNIGCAAAKGEFLVFASAHVYPTRKDWIEQLVAPFRQDRVALVYGKQRGNEITRFSEEQIFRQWFPDDPADDQSHHFCNNANCAVRRTWWQQIGYDEMLTGLEDLAWAKEAMKRGGRLVYAPHAEIIHIHDESWSRIQNRYCREAIALKHIEPHLSFGLKDFFWLAISNVVTDLRAARQQSVLRQEARGIFLFRLNQFWGTYKGYRFDASVTRDVRNRFYFPAAAIKSPAQPPSGHMAGGRVETLQIDYSE
ncbi:MAG: glycosyltransferase family A protein [Beijerinckiaceae bacterium]|nr:glycosyltransferase family A protein [Beijerinckiaceae bacterium]